MKKTFTTLFFAALVLTVSTAFIVKYQNGAVAGYTGSPGEQTCAGGGCHSGGSSANKSVTITASPSFTGGAYLPDSTYDITLTVAASSFTRFGFACEVLNSSNTNCGTMQSPGSGVQLLNAGNGRRNATHTTPKAGAGNQATFMFKWVAPSAGEGNATFYYCCNAVNFNGATNGDVPIQGNMVLAEGTPPTTTTSIGEIAGPVLSGVSVYPNPSVDFSTISYNLSQAKNIQVELVEISGKQVKVLSNKMQHPGSHSEIIDLRGTAKGVYFVKTSSGGVQLSQKMLVVN